MVGISLFSGMVHDRSNTTFFCRRMRDLIRWRRRWLEMRLDQVHQLSTTGHCPDSLGHDIVPPWEPTSTQQRIPNVIVVIQDHMLLSGRDPEVPVTLVRISARLERNRIVLPAGECNNLII